MAAFAGQDLQADDHLLLMQSTQVTQSIQGRNLKRDSLRFVQTVSFHDRIGRTCQ